MNKATPVVCQEWFKKLPEEKKNELYVMSNCVFNTQVVVNGKFLNTKMSARGCIPETQNIDQIKDENIELETFEIVYCTQNSDIKQAYLKIIEEKIRYEKYVYDAIVKELNIQDEITTEDIIEILKES